jgi:hypothetical protein
MGGRIRRGYDFDEQMWRSRMHSSGHKGLITIMFVCLYAIYDVARLER